MKHINDFRKFNEGLGTRIVAKAAAGISLTFGALKNLIKLNFKDFLTILKFTPHLGKLIDITDLIKDQEEGINYEEYVLENFPDDYPISFPQICGVPALHDYGRESMKREYKKRFNRDIVRDILDLESFINKGLEKEVDKELDPKSHKLRDGVLEMIDGLKATFIPRINMQIKTVAEIRSTPRRSRFQQRLDDYQREFGRLDGERDPLQDEIPRY